MNIIVYDTETTGIPKHPDAKMDVQPKVIEFAGIIVNEKGEALEELSLLIDPQEPLEAIITKITGITDEDLVGAPLFPQAEQKIRAFFAKADAAIAHNLPFDQGMIELEVQRHGLEAWPWPQIMICTVQEHAEEWGRRPKLTELYLETFGKPLEQTHRALDDVMALAAVCKERGVLDDIAAIAR